MKNLGIIIVLILLSSCEVVYFARPQPKNGKTQKVVPNELIGRWGKEHDSLIITKYGFELVTENADNPELITIGRITNLLSDSLILKKAGKYYVGNYKHNKNWEVFVVLERKKNGDIYGYYPFESPFFGKIKPVNRDSLGLDEYLKDSIDLQIKNYYKGDIKKKDIKKVITPVNLLWILKKNGTVEKPNIIPDTIRFDMEIPYK